LKRAESIPGKQPRAWGHGSYDTHQGPCVQARSPNEGAGIGGVREMDVYTGDTEAAGGTSG